MLMRSPAEHLQLPASLESSLTLVQEWLIKLADARNLELDFRNLRAVLINLLEIVEEHPSITAAACSPLACLACKRWQMTDMAPPSVRGNVDYVRERGFVPGPKVMGGPTTNSQLRARTAVGVWTFSSMRRSKWRG
jgi:hypothetical protein